MYYDKEVVFLKINWIKELVVGAPEKAELYVVISAKEAIEKLYRWSRQTGAIIDVCSVEVENGKEIMTAVIAKDSMTLLVVAKEEKQGAKIYLSANGKKGAPLLHSIFRVQKVRDYLNSAIDMLLSVTEKIM